MGLEIPGIWGGFWGVVFNAGSLGTKPCCLRSAGAELEQRHRGEREPVQRFATGLGGARGGLGGPKVRFWGSSHLEEAGSRGAPIALGHTSPHPGPFHASTDLKSTDTGHLF